MSNSETSNVATSGNTGPNPADGGVLCGTGTLPPCPASAVYLGRNALIYQLAGTRTDQERVRRAAERVDEYLVGVLRSALELTLPLTERLSTTPA